MQNEIFILILVAFNIITVFQSMVQGDSFSIELIHRDSPKSPFYNQSLSPSETLTQDVRRSHARVSRLNSHSSYTNVKEVVSSMEGNGNTYLTRYYLGSKKNLGSKKFEVLAFVSMMTDFILTKCFSMHQQDDTSFKGKDSSDSYEILRASDDDCKLFPFRELDDNYGECAYNYVVNVEKKNIHSYGVVSRDKFSFLSRNMEPKNILFGCSKLDSGLDSEVQGVVGFGLGRISLPSQLGSDVNQKFSYCLRSNADKGISTLKFGDIDETIEAKMNSSPLDLPYHMTSLYFVYLRGVSVAGSKMIRTSEISHRIAIDVGTPMTYLKKYVYTQVVKRVKQILGPESPISSKGFNLCFNNTFKTRNLLPRMAFHFFRGAKLSLARQNVFVYNDIDKKYCLAIFPAEDDELSILGSQAQLDHIIQFGLKEGGTVYWTGPQGCDSFES